MGPCVASGSVSARPGREGSDLATDWSDGASRASDQPVLTGSCFCRALTYAIGAPLTEAQSCHCSRCRKVFSGAGSAFAFLAAGSFEWTSETGSLSRYATEGGWEIGFCARCGSTLCGIHEGTVKGITLGTVDGDPGIQLSRHIFVGSKASWDHIGGDAERFEEGPQ